MEEDPLSQEILKERKRKYGPEKMGKSGKNKKLDNDEGAGQEDQKNDELMSVKPW